MIRICIHFKDVCACRCVNMTQLGIRNNSTLRETASTSLASGILTGLPSALMGLRKRGQNEPIPTSYIPAKAAPTLISLSGSSGSQSRKHEFPAQEFLELSLKKYTLEEKCR